MMLFLIGLEIRPSELWSMRRKFLRYGVSQILLTTLVIGLVVYYFTAQINLSIIAGFVLALSHLFSKSLNEKFCNFVYDKLMLLIKLITSLSLRCM